VPLDSLRIMGSLEGAPVLPNNPLAPKASKAASAPQAQAPGSPPVSVTDLKEVTTASVNSEQLNMRQGPGPAYQVLTVLTRDETVSLLASNRPKDWVLVKTSSGQIGWVYLEYLKVAGSLAELPILVSAAPDSGIAPGEAASVLDSTPPVGAKTQPTPLPPSSHSPDASRGDSTPPTAKPKAQPVSLLTTLRPLATGRPSQGEVTLYRGPGSTYEPIVTLYVDDSVDILGLAPGSQMPPASGDWVLVKPRDKSPGWAVLRDLTLEGSLDGGPQVTTAWVASNEVHTRSGPGLTYERNGVMAIHTMVCVLGVNHGHSWALVTPVLSSGYGWLPLNFLSLGGAWADMPELPDATLAEAAPTEAATPRPARVAAQPQGNLVIQLSSGGDIMIIPFAETGDYRSADGAGLRRLTSGIDPVLSPDGSMVAFTRWTGDDGSVWVINADGTGERLVLGSTKQAKHPAWSPDGRKIVVNFQHGGQLGYEESCTDLIRLGGRRPNIPWNVDADSIRVTIREGRPYLCWDRPPDPWWGLRVVTLSDGGYQDVPSDRYAYGPEWDPANSWRIVSSGNRGLVQLDANRQEQWALTDRREDHTPVFSPDGRYVAVSYDQRGGYDIHRMNSDGSGRVRLTQTPLWVTAAPDGGKQWNNVSPAWSPDGSQIAFLTDRTGHWEIWVMNWDGSNPHALFPKAVNDQLTIRYEFVDERVLSWR
jgi:TolB protein